MSKVADPPGDAFDIGRVLGRTFQVVGGNARTLILMALAFGVAPQAAMGLTGSLLSGGGGLPGFWLGFAVGFVGGLMLQASVVHAAIVHLNGGKAAFGESVRVALVNLPAVLGIAVLTAVAAAVPAFIGGALLKIGGLAISLVPIMMMMVVWLVAVPAQVIERVGVIQSFGRSAELTRGCRWRILGLLLIYLFLAAIFGIAFAIVLAVVSRLIGWAPGLVVPIILLPVVSATFSTIAASAVAAVYHELRSRKEGAAPQTLATVFD